MFKLEIFMENLKFFYFWKNFILRICGRNEVKIYKIFFKVRYFFLTFFNKGVLNILFWGICRGRFFLIGYVYVEVLFLEWFL